MSGVPGSGKSTLAREIAKRISCIIVDNDIVKTALLNSIEETTIDGKSAGKISYNIDFSLVDFYLSLGQNVILDSPCLYDEMIDKGTKLAAKYNASYKYIECYLEDFTEVNQRLKNRERLPSQITEFQSEPAFYKTLESSKKPLNHRCIVVNTAMVLESYMEDVMRYLITDS